MSDASKEGQDNSLENKSVFDGVQDVSNLYKKCKGEINLWLGQQSWWLSISEIINQISKCITNIACESYVWEKGYLYTILKPKLKKDLEMYGLPYIETLAEHYVDEHLPFQNELIDEIVNDNLKRMIDEIYEKLTE